MDINLVPILSESKKLLKAIKYNDAELVIQILKTNPSLCNIYAHDTLAKKKIFPLHLAAVYGCTDCLTILLQQKIDVNMITRTGDTPLHCSRSNASTLLLLNEKRADIHKKNYSGKTAFFYSVLPIVKNEASYDQRSYKTARTLLEKGAKIDVADCHGNTVLHTAVLHKDYNAIYFLLQHGASPHKRNKKPILVPSLRL